MLSNIEDFLKDGAVEQLNKIIEKAQKKHEKLLASIKVAEKPKAPKAQAKRKKKNLVAESFEKTKIKDKLTTVSQKLVIDLVERIEKNDLLKEGIYAENLKFGVCGSADNIVPWPKVARR